VRSVKDRDDGAGDFLGVQDSGADHDRAERRLGRAAITLLE